MVLQGVPCRCKAPGLNRERGKGEPIKAPEAPTAPATVCGERPSIVPLAPRFGAGKAEGALRPASQETGLAKETRTAVGCDGMEKDMNQTTTHSPARIAALVPVLFTALLGATVIFLAGHAQSSSLHDAAHDVRHATGFPCH